MGPILEPTPSLFSSGGYYGYSAEIAPSGTPSILPTLGPINWARCSIRDLADDIHSAGPVRGADQSINSRLWRRRRRTRRLWSPAPGSNHDYGSNENPHYCNGPKHSITFPQRQSKERHRNGPGEC